MKIGGILQESLEIYTKIKTVTGTIRTFYGIIKIIPDLTSMYTGNLEPTKQTNKQVSEKTNFSGVKVGSSFTRDSGMTVVQTPGRISD